ncbi:hypothetical protein GGR42_000475 [Saonia flava]|uniref:Lipoprotein n=1 Tax=Saonia flava TaxID=523696 RepID=A0A846QUN4_9FLAO|nr:hypothetical protein [Saonia flava]NJB70013.1 hypothetical protein [Saonia flava]
MKKLLFLPILIFTIAITSCSKDEQDVNIDSNLTGTWNGAYSGDDRGIWTVNVDANGNVSGTATSAYTQDSQNISGKVTDNGTLSATLGNTDDREFVGQLKENNEATGTWIDAGRNMEGTWEGSKQ